MPRGLTTDSAAVVQVLGRRRPFAFGYGVPKDVNRAGCRTASDVLPGMRDRPPPSPGGGRFLTSRGRQRVSVQLSMVPVEPA